MAIASIRAITQANVIPTKEGSVNAVLYDLLGRVIHQQQLSFTNGEALMKVQATSGNYILKRSDAAGNSTHQRIIIE